MPFFSVIIPTYNRSESLKKAVDSVLAQTFKDFEILIMDDGSDDDTSDVINEFKDARVIYQWDFNFGGPARPRNRGLKLAKGEWLCFLDADDWWSCNKLQVCKDYIEKGGIDFIYHDLFIVRDKKKFWQSNYQKGGHIERPVFINLLVNGNIIPNSSVVVRKNIMVQIGGFSEATVMIAGEDFHAWLRIAQLTDSFLYIPKKLGFYLLHHSNISKKDMSQVYINVIQEFLHFLNLKQINIINSSMAYMKGRYYFIHGKYDSAFKEFSLIKNINLKIRVKIIIMICIVWIKKLLI